MLYKCEQMFYTKEGLYNAYEAFIVYSKILPQRIYFRFGSWQHGLFFCLKTWFVLAGAIQSFLCNKKAAIQPPFLQS